MKLPPDPAEFSPEVIDVPPISSAPASIRTTPWWSRARLGALSDRLGTTFSVMVVCRSAPRTEVTGTSGTGRGRRPACPGRRSGRSLTATMQKECECLDLLGRQRPLRHDHRPRRVGTDRLSLAEERRRGRLVSREGVASRDSHPASVRFRYEHLGLPTPLRLPLTRRGTPMPDHGKIAGVPAHRWAVDQAVGHPITPGLHVLHLRAAPFTEPTHLTMGTPTANARDKLPGRHACGKGHGLAQAD
jgi:hypothetical protein